MDIKIPNLGESIKEARIVRWLKQDGDFVKMDEPVVEIETDKASDSIPAPGEGVVRITAQADQAVAVGAVIGRIEAGKAPTKAAPSPPSKKEEPVAAPPAKTVEVTKTPAPVVEPPQPAVKEAPTGGRETTSRETRQRMSPIRQRIAEKLVASQQTTATLTTFNEADMTQINECRARYKEEFKKRHGVGLGFMSFFVKAAVAALKAFPNVNARMDGADLVLQHYYDIGVAVSTERGLLVPVLRDADKLTFADIEKKIGELAGLARDGKLSASHLQGGTFTITNGGIFGSMLSTPILNPPQCGILGMHTIQKRPVAIDDQVVIRPMMYLALSYDHRLIDGREAVMFLVRIKELIENPARMLFDL